jgi:cell division protein FtsB
MATLDRLGPAPAQAQPATTWRPRRALAVAITIVAVIALLQVVQSSSFAHTGRQLERLDVQRATLKAQVADLEAQVAQLSSLDRTEQVAVNKLGMVRARNVSYLSVGVDAPAGPLLPRPLISTTEPQPAGEPWWKSLYKALPLP